MAGKSPLSSLGGSLTDLQEAASERLKDSEALFEAGRYASAIAFGLYALEIELKVVICRRLDLGNLPRVFETHDLTALMMHSGLSGKISRVRRPESVKQNWDDLLLIGGTVEQFRYQNDPVWDERMAGRVLHQLRDSPNGVLLWLKRQASLRAR